MSQLSELKAYPYVYQDLSESRDRQRSALCVVVLQYNEDPMLAVFGMGESLCHPEDNFKKAVGAGVARGRAKGALDCPDGSCLFTLGEVVAASESGDPILTPLTLTPIPHGVRNRLTNLLGVDVGDEIWSKINKICA